MDTGNLCDLAIACAATAEPQAVSSRAGLPDRPAMHRSILQLASKPVSGEHESAVFDGVEDMRSSADEEQS